VAEAALVDAAAMSSLSPPNSLERGGRKRRKKKW
jgi:hypothetical protein